MSALAGVLKVVERQLGLWELKRRLQDLGNRPGRCLEGPVAYGPCLLMSRERGSGGTLVARILGERLGWHVFDREVVDQIAELAHVRQQLLESLDEATRAHVLEEWRPELEPQDIGYEQYLRFLREVILALGHHGDVIILGRGAQYLLPVQCAVRARIVAPLEFRVRRVMETLRLPLVEAQHRVEQLDASKTDFIRRCFQRDPQRALNYDLTINTGEVSLEGAASLILVVMKDKLGVQPPRG